MEPCLLADCCGLLRTLLHDVVFLAVRKQPPKLATNLHCVAMVTILSKNSPAFTVKMHQVCSCKFQVST